MNRFRCFEIDSCKMKACLNWRIGDVCVKDNFVIADYLYAANIHDSTTCQVRKQIDLFRLELILED